MGRYHNSVDVMAAVVRACASGCLRRLRRWGSAPIGLLAGLASLVAASLTGRRGTLSAPDSALTGAGRLLPTRGRRRAPLFKTRLVAVAGVVIAVVAVTGLSGALAATGQTLVVTSTADEPDRAPGDGTCRGASGECTLRAAIMESNALSGRDTIEIAPGVYELEIPTLNEDTGATGDYDITNTVTIQGAGIGVTVVDGGWPLEGSPVEERGMDRLFEIHPNASYVLFKDLTIREGYTDEAGAGIQN